MHEIKNGLEASSKEQHEAFEKITAWQSAMQTRMAVGDEKFKVQEEKYAAIDAAVFGNGHPGLKTNVQTIMTYVRVLTFILGLLATAFITKWVNELPSHRETSYLQQPDSITATTRTTGR